MRAIYIFLNYFFFVFHTVLVFFNCLGWIWKKTRIWNLITLFLTAFSWFFLGIWYGWGYCLCTDWHFKVRELLGFRDISNSYIHFLILNLTGFNFSEPLVESITLIVFLAAVALSVFVNLRGLLKRISR